MVMPERLKVLFLLHPIKPEFFTPWGDDVVAAIGGRHDLHVIKHRDPLPPELADADVVEHGGHTDKAMRHLAATLFGRLRLWQILGTGVDKFDMAYWREHKIPVANTPGQFSSVALAECAMMFMIMLARKYAVTQTNLHSGMMYEPMGIELGRLKLGIIGFWASGRELARRASAFGMKIMAIDVRDIGADEAREFDLEFAGKPADMDKVIAESDVLSLHLHLTDETRYISIPAGWR
jgi:phosphoglycerate dehydrogenase-like enzyme